MYIQICHRSTKINQFGDSFSNDIQAHQSPAALLGLQKCKNTGSKSKLVIHSSNMCIPIHHHSTQTSQFGDSFWNDIKISQFGDSFWNDIKISQFGDSFWNDIKIGLFGYSFWNDFLAHQPQLSYQAHKCINTGLKPFYPSMYIFTIHLHLTKISQLGNSFWNDFL